MADKGASHSKGTAQKRFFFKVLMRDFSGRLKFPPEFVQHKSWESTGIATISGPSGGVWHADFRKGQGNEAFLEGDWHKFVEDHSLEEFDFLLFKYNGKMHFTIKIFGKNMCEKEIAFASKDAEVGQTKWVELDELSLDYQELSENSSYSRNVAECQSNAVKMEEPNLPTGPLQGHESQCPSRRSLVHKGKINLSKKSKTFSRIMTNYNIRQGGYLYMPEPFAKSNLPRVSTTITLQGPDGRRWPVKCLTTHGECRLVGGWRTFVQVYDLKEGDTCSFEVVSQKEMKVKIESCAKK